MSWTSSGLRDRFLLYLGRGTGGVMDADELWTDARTYQFLADAQETVYAELAPIAPHAFVGAPQALVTADGGVTYTYPGGAYPFGHVEVYAQETGGRTLYATSYGNSGGDFVFEGALIRTPGNRARNYASGPWARYTAFPTRLSSTQQPALTPDAARELILFKALELAAEVSNGAMDPSPWATKYAQARQRWIALWQTQYLSHGTQAAGGDAWWLTLDALNDAVPEVAAVELSLLVDGGGA